MNNREPSTEQASALHAALFPRVNFLLRLSWRLEDLRFPADDPLRAAAKRADDSAMRLHQEAHRLSVRIGSVW